MDSRIQEFEVLPSQKKEFDQDGVASGRNRQFIKKKSASQQGTGDLGQVRCSMAPALS